MPAALSLTSPLDIAQVGQSWVDTNREGFLFAQMPNGFAPYSPDGYGTVTYRIPAFDNSLQKGTGLDNWQPGDALPMSRAVGEETVTITPIGRTTDLISRAAERPVANRFADLENNISPILLSQAYQGLDLAAVAFLKNASNFTQETFTGTGALDVFSNDQIPFYNVLQKAIAPLRKYSKSVPGMAVEWWMESHVLDVIIAHWNFQGAGAAVSALALAAGPMVQLREGLRSMLESTLGVTVKIFDTVSDTVERGLTSAPQEISFGLCWIGVVDRRAGSWNIMSADVIKPDGAIQIGLAMEPQVDSFIIPGSKQETFRALTAFDIFSPRGSEWGFLFPVSEIIT